MTKGIESKKINKIKKLNENIFLKLLEPLEGEAIQKTKKEETRKGYDTIGYGYQYIVNRFNDIFENRWGFNYQIIKEIEGNFKSGQPYYDIIVEMEIWIDNNKENTRKCVGGHISVNYADALKGAITNAFKKTASFWGVGREAYEGSVDDDNLRQEEGIVDVKTKEIKNNQIEEKEFKDFEISKDIINLKENIPINLFNYFFKKISLKKELNNVEKNILLEKQLKEKLNYEIDWFALIECIQNVYKKIGEKEFNKILEDFNITNIYELEKKETIEFYKLFLKIENQ